MEGTVDVKYESGTARFVDQMRIRRPCEDAGFLAAGDSGSLIVTVPNTSDDPDPHAVGLLFAGSDTDTFANPIQAVLKSMGVVLGSMPVSMVSGTDGDNEGAMRSDYDSIADCPTSEAKARHSEEIFALPDVVGHGIVSTCRARCGAPRAVRSRARLRASPCASLRPARSAPTVPASAQ